MTWDQINEEVISKIAQANYNLSIEKISVLSKEPNNKQVYKILADNQEFKINVLREFGEGITFVKRFIPVLEFLQSTRICSPHILFTNTNLPYLHQDNLIIWVTRFIPGSEINLDSAPVYKIGKYLAKLHQLNIQEIPPPVSIKDPVSNLIRFQKKIIDKIEKPLKPYHQKFGDEILKGLADLPTFSNLPRSLIIGDGHIGNFIKLEDSTACCIDWEFSGIGTSLYDLADFIASNIIHINEGNHFENDLVKVEDSLSMSEDIFSAFLNGYQSQRELSLDERSNLVPMMKYFTLSYAIEDEVDTVNIAELAKFRFIKKTDFAELF